MITIFLFRTRVGPCLCHLTHTIHISKFQCAHPHIYLSWLDVRSPFTSNPLTIVLISLSSSEVNRMRATVMFSSVLLALLKRVRLQFSKTDSYFKLDSRRTWKWDDMGSKCTNPGNGQL